MVYMLGLNIVRNVIAQQRYPLGQWWSLIRIATCFAGEMTKNIVGGAAY